MLLSEMERREMRRLGWPVVPASESRQPAKSATPAARESMRAHLSSPVSQAQADLVASRSRGELNREDEDLLDLDLSLVSGLGEVAASA